MKLRLYALALWTLLSLFVLRVGGQILVAMGFGGFLPPWEEWFSGLISYPGLLASQIVIIALFTKVCLDVTRERGFFVVPRRGYGSAVVRIGSVYLGVMVIRYIIRMALYPPERWTGGSIPIFFHCVLAGFLLTVGAFNVRFAPAPLRLHPARTRALQGAYWLLVAIAIF